MKTTLWVLHLPASVMQAERREATQALLRAGMLGLLQRIWVAERHHQIWEGAEPLRVAMRAERRRRRQVA
jgi:hypothetical protein